MPNGGLIGGSAGILAAAGFFAYAVRGRSSSVFGPSVYHGDRSRRSLALTFDDGPSESTPELLDILAEYKVPATFFLCGTNVSRLPNIARNIAERGHEVGNHSDRHPFFHRCSASVIYRELASAQEKIEQATGKRPVLFRAPYGVRWFGLAQAQKDLHLLGVMWSTIARDWVLPADGICERLLKSPRNGDILCLHDGRTTQANPDIRATLDAVRRVIPELQHRGFQFETVSQLLQPSA